ncbi:hypothetical protein [Flaviflagellibacter deserti]|jgi:hypothetical protein|uniref:Uncharacterized protein n=1 Tax=Flaviflagellibacter deserti TaxID=2267266 RepID=A0ABV9YVD6_9HYPH
MAALLLSSGLIVGILVAVPDDCATAKEVVAETQGEAARITVIDDRAELQLALDFMFRNSNASPPPAESLVVIERTTNAEIVMFERGCAATKAISSPDLAARMLRAARPKDGFI